MVVHLVTIIGNNRFKPRLYAWTSCGIGHYGDLLCSTEIKEVTCKLCLKTSDALPVSGVKKCSNCNNYQGDFTSKDYGQTITNDKGDEWDMARCMHCVHEERDDLFEPKNIEVTLNRKDCK